MRKILLRLMVFVMSLVMLTGCTNDTLSVENTLHSQQDTVNQSNDTETKSENEDKYRILITSDMHYTSLCNYYDVDKDVRLQYWVDGILAEHKKNPFDLIVILGDMSLDYWAYNGGGSWQRNPKVSDSKEFVDKYVSQLPEDVPTLVMPGNHELYTNKKWKEITGNNRDEYFALGENLFIIPDSYAGAIDPIYQAGLNDAPYKPVNMTFIQNALDAHPECTNVFLLSHQFDLSQESKEFKNLLKNDERIVGLFSGHTHYKAAIDLGTEYRNLKHIKTGNFASTSTQDKANFFWGYRDIIIANNNIVSKYIVAKSEYFVNGKKYTSECTYTDSVRLPLGKK